MLKHKYVMKILRLKEILKEKGITGRKSSLLWLTLRRLVSQDLVKGDSIA